MSKIKVPDLEAFLSQAHYYQALCDEYVRRTPTGELRENMIRMSRMWQEVIRNIALDQQMVEASRHLLIEVDDLLGKV